jgi:hypothetical protein
MSSSGEVYGMHIMPDRFNTDILLPNGLCITLLCKREDTLEAVKRQLWKTIKMTTAKYFHIGDQSSFIFSAITLDAKLEEFYEESRRLCDLRLFDLMLKLIEPEGNKEEKRISSMIDLAIGKKINELFIELPRDIREEVGDFRKSTRDYEENILNQIDQGLIFSSYSNYVDVPYKIKIISATYVNVKNVDSIFVRAAIYHGNECLGARDTTHVEPSNPKWDQWLKFDFHCTDLPQSAKICLSVCISSKKRTKEVCSLGYVNMSVFDHRGVMRSGRTQLNLWPPPKSTDDLLFPFMTLGNNPNNDSPCLSLELLSFDRYVAFAPIHDMYAYAAHAIKQEPAIDHENIQIPGYLAMSNSSSNAGSSTNCHTHYSSIRLDFRDRTLSNSCADTRAFIERRLSSSSNNRRDSMSTTYNDNFSIRSRRPTTSSEKFSAPSSRTSSTASMLTRLDLNAPSTKYTHNLPALSNNVTSNTLTNNSPVPSNSSVSASHTTSISPVASPTVPHVVSNIVKSQTPDSSITNPYSPIEGSAAASEASSLLSTPALGASSTEEERIAHVNQLIAMPPFTALSASQKSFLWSMRFYCKRVPESLPRLLDAIDWKSRSQLSQLYVLLDEWGQVSLETALRLLNTKYEDKYVRQHAVKWLNECLDDEMLSCYLLQFVQVLKTEPYLENELSRFMNNRALSNPNIGNLFFWYLKSECDEVNDYHNTIRFRYVLERYLRGLSESRLSTLVRQVQGLDKLMNLAEALRDKSKEDRIKFMHSQMQRVDFMEMLQNIPDPVNNNRFLGQLLYEECRIMDSAKRPLWLVWSLPIITDEHEAELYPANPKSEEDVEKMLPSVQNNRRSHSYSGGKDLTNREVKPTSTSIKEEDSSALSGDSNEKGSRFNARTMTSSSDSAKGSITGRKAVEPSEMNVISPSNGRPAMATSAIIFKIGDDLRQDMLTLQVIKIVDSIWKQEGLDMCMLAYTCLSTGKNVGIIEVVNRAETITSIQKSGGRMATIQIDSSQLHRWIKERNHDNYDEAIDRFTRSCAGYSVLTFVLGIADRNPDNIMVSEDGRIFHIDFGHFLGHFKRKFGINRERVPFVLTEDFLHVIARGSDVRRGGSFDAFRNLCGDAYISLRRHTNLLITLFEMMLRTGIPELKTVEDMSWLTTSLQIGVTEEKAREYFQAQFFEAYCGAWATKVDWFFHNIKRM